MKRRLIFLLICLELLFQIAIGEDYLTQAKSKKDIGLYWEAIELLEKALKSDSKNDIGWKVLGECYLRVKEFNKAKVSLEKAQNLNPNDSEITRLLDEIKSAQKMELQAQINAYNSYLVRYPKNDEYRLKLARAYREYGDLLSAQREYEIYLANNPNATAVKEEYVKTFLKPAQRGKDAPIKKESRSKTYLKQLDQARDLVSQERYAPAESLYEAYLAKNPTDTTAWREYANMLAWNEEYEKSIKAYRHLLTLNPNDKKSAFELARVLTYKGDYKGAIAQYLTLDTTDLKVLTGLAQTYDWQGDYPKALKIYQRILIADPKNPWALKRVQELSSKIAESPQHTPAIQGSALNTWDSEEFYLKRYTTNLSLNLSEKTGLEPSFAYSQFEQRADFITACSYSLRITEKLSEAVSGQVFYTYNIYDCLDNTHSYGLSLKYVPPANSNFDFRYDHYSIVEDVLTTRSLIHSIMTDKFTIEGSYSFEKGYGLAFYYSYGAYSDSNQVQNPQARLFYQLFPILLIGYSYNLLAYSFSSNYYWSPDFYQTHSLWFELANGSTTALSYFVRAEIAKITNSAKLARSFATNLSFNPPKTAFAIGFQFSYSELSRTTDVPAYWYQSLSAYLVLKL
uniref:Tetratricopeptide repeat protein n=1 Tax=candidate division WOR-3 bacterium TaxID=2052148 RepID=A0A7C6EBD6_UNCW3